ncbi:hypothetical protein C725_0570 [Pacificimonas flava]|jgi:hypothetical protein|uniref:Uncharacterized protein n=1 Tax=Pacificimonas flava TaxID=1234595 RepID=M2U6H2_9SPHN|nr:hypothetical protein C725_0570 [Pacificimonas flava]|tara:strand:- start:571 stop:696 length:126 start_codon:yes stop_codon:yes gene_type:complete
MAPDLLEPGNAWFDETLDFIMVALRAGTPTGCRTSRSEKQA